MPVMYWHCSRPRAYSMGVYLRGADALGRTPYETSPGPDTSAFASCSTTFYCGADELAFLRVSLFLSEVGLITDLGHFKRINSIDTKTYTLVPCSKYKLNKCQMFFLINKTEKQMGLLPKGTGKKRQKIYQAALELGNCQSRQRKR